MGSPQPQKPLPSIPTPSKTSIASSSTTTTTTTTSTSLRLTVESHAHLVKSLKLALRQEALDGAWATIILRALDELVGALERGQWLRGIRAQRDRRVATGEDGDDNGATLETLRQLLLHPTNASAASLLYSSMVTLGRKSRLPSYSTITSGIRTIYGEADETGGCVHTRASCGE